VLAVAVMAVTLLGCGDDSRGAGAEAATSSSATTSTTRAEVSTTSTTVPETTTSTVPAIEPPDNTGTDMVAILQRLSDFGNRLGMAPNLEAVDLAYVPGSPAHKGIVNIVQSLIENGWHWSGPTEELREIVDNGAVGSTGWTLSAVSVPIESARLLDEGGELVHEQPPAPEPERLIYVLARGDDGRWRIADIQFLSKA
jgi:hypothetical protein